MGNGETTLSSAVSNLTPFETAGCRRSKRTLVLRAGDLRIDGREMGKGCVRGSTGAAGAAVGGGGAPGAGAPGAAGGGGAGGAGGGGWGVGGGINRFKSSC